MTFVSPLADRLGGSENMLWAILRHGRSAGLEAKVVCLEGGPLVDDLERLGVPATVIAAGRLRQPRRTLSAVARLGRLLHTDSPDVVVSWTAKAHAYTAPAARLARIADRTVWWQHSVPAGHWVDRMATALPAVAVGCSSRACAAAQAHLHPRRRTFVVYPGVDPPGSASVSPMTRQDLGIVSDLPVVAIVGRLQPWKGQDRVVRAASLLRQQGVDMHLLVVGGDAYGLSPGYTQRVREMIDEHGLVDRTTLTGHVPSADPYVELSDIVVNASNAEPFGLVLVEAMALGVAVVGVDAGGPAEIIEHGRSGWLVPDSAPATIAHALERLLGDDGLRRRLAEQGRRRALEHFTAARMTERLAAELSNAVRPRACA